MEQKQQLQQEPLLNAMIKFVQSYMDAQSDIKSNKIMQTASDETIAELRLCGIPQKRTGRRSCHGRNGGGCLRQSSNHAAPSLVRIRTQPSFTALMAR